MWSGKLHDDTELHILLFDIIYCSHVYDLFDGITFLRPKSKEKKLIVEQKNKAKALLDAYNEAKTAAEQLADALMFFVSQIKEAEKIKHKAYGACSLISVDSNYLRIMVDKTGEEKQLGLAVVIANGIVTIDSEVFKEKQKEYLPILKSANSIPGALEYASRTLEPYEEYLD